MTTTAKHIRPGFRTLTPTIRVEGADRFIDFVKNAFGAEEVDRTTAGDGTILNAQVRIGDSMLEVSDPRGEWTKILAALHVYLSDTDDAYKRAMRAGATSLYEPAQMPYGERSAGVVDPAGNHWYIATYTGDMGSE